MKTTTIKKLLVGSLSVVSLLFYSCSGNKSDSNTSSNEDPKKEAEEHNDAKFDKASEDDAQFLVDAATINMKEVKLGTLASTNGETKEVRDLGKMMAEVHSKAQIDLEILAGKKGITLPASVPNESEKDYNALKDEHKISFDKKYSNQMVDGHKEAISKFVKASTDCQDADIRDWASKMLPDLRSHLDQAMNCQNQLRAYKE